MTRRRIVAIASAAAIFAMALIVVLVVVAVTQTGAGRERVRDLVLSQVASKVNGSMYVGRITGGLLTGVTIDSIEIRGEDDSLFVASGPITLAYDPRDFFDRRLLFQTVSIERPIVHLRQYPDGDWNYKRIFPKGEERRQRSERGYGDYIVIDTATISGGRVRLTLPWRPADSLSGARRDSAVQYNLAREDALIRRAGRGFTRTYRWNDVDAALSQVRLADPASRGRFVEVAKLSTNELDPPFAFSNVRGTVRILKDSLWVDVQHFDLPASTGRAEGKIVWGSGLPTRWALDIVGDSVSLNDVAWVYPTLPTTGGGKMKLAIRTAEDDLHVIEYAITDMDVRTTGSRLLGDMTYAVGVPVLVVKDVELEAAPVDFRLIHHLSGGPLPVDWQGTLSGRVRARGGPLNRFQVDESRIVFRDAHVAGAESRLSGRGGLDILFPSLTKFRDFEVDVASLDLRTIQNLFPDTPPLDGFVQGTATLDSLWLDVRFRNADIIHTDGPGDSSHLLGSGRVTWGEPFMTFDVDLTAERLAFTTLARSFEGLPLRGTYSGPLRVNGTVESLDLTAALTGPAGALAIDGHFDVFPPGFAARGRGSVTGLDLRTLLAHEDVPASDLTGRFTMDVEGDSLASLAGSARAELDRSLLAGVRFYPSIGQFRFADARVLVDTLSVETAAASVAASGVLALADGDRDSLAFTVTVDSLGGLRRWLGVPADSVVVIAPPGAPPAPNALTGFLQLTGTLSGSLGELDAGGSVLGRDLVIVGHRARTMTGEFALDDVLGELRGRGSLRLDTLVVSDIRFVDAAADWRLDAYNRGRVSVRAVSANSPVWRLAADFHGSTDTTTLRIDTLTIEPGGTDAWRLAAPTVVTLHDSGVALAPMTLRSRSAGSLSARAELPHNAPIDVRIAADSLSLGEVGVLAQLPLSLTGRSTFEWTITGTRADPVMQAHGTLSNVHAGSLRLEFANVRVGYEDRRLDGGLNLYRRGEPVLSGTVALPLDLALAPVARRKLDAPLRGSIRADSVDLAVLEAMLPTLQNATGILTSALDIGGSWDQPQVRGHIRIDDGAAGISTLGVRLRRINADIALMGDSIHLRRLSAWSPREGGSGEAGDTASLTGWVKFGEFDNPRFDLQLAARDFHVMDMRGVANLDISSRLRLTGAWNGAALTGGVTLERGQIYIPELVQKRAIDLNDPELYDVVDTSNFAVEPLLPDVPSEFVQNLALQNVRIAIGPDVWLRSSEARIQLSGAVNVTSSQRGWANEPARLALEGTLNADRGVYRLILGPVQRDFQVDRGRVTFFGDATLNPGLDISAVHTVRQYQQQDVRIRVNIRGTLNQPELALVSDEGLPISQSDLLSYLVTGAPSFSIGNTDAGQTAASVILPSVGSWVGGLLAGAVDLDLVQVQTASTDVRNGGLSETGRDFLSGTTLGIGKQISDRTFLIANAGLCQIVKQSDASEGNLLNSLGVKIEHRFNHGFSVEAGVEPASKYVLCNATGLRGTVETPRQLGIDLFRAWSF